MTTGRTLSWNDAGMFYSDGGGSSSESRAPSTGIADAFSRSRARGRSVSPMTNPLNPPPPARRDGDPPVRYARPKGRSLSDPPPLTVHAAKTQNFCRDRLHCTHYASEVSSSKSAPNSPRRARGRSTPASDENALLSSDDSDMPPLRNMVGRSSSMPDLYARPQSTSVSSVSSASTPSPQPDIYGYHWTLKKKMTNKNSG